LLGGWHYSDDDDHIGWVEVDGFYGSIVTFALSRRDDGIPMLGDMKMQ